MRIKSLLSAAAVALVLLPAAGAQAAAPTNCSTLPIYTGSTSVQRIAKARLQNPTFTGTIATNVTESCIAGTLTDRDTNTITIQNSRIEATILDPTFGNLRLLGDAISGPPASTEKEEAERIAREKAEREAREKAERELKEQAEREAREKAEREAKEKAEREAAEKAQHEKEAKEAAEKAQHEREVKEQAEREAREQKEREEAEHKGTRTKECLGHEVECGFPSQATVGVEPGQTLTPSGPVQVKTEGQVVHNLRITGEEEGPYIEVFANNVTIKNVEIEVANLRHKVCEQKVNSNGNAIIKLSNGVTSRHGLKIEHVTIHGKEAGCPGLGGIPINNANPEQHQTDIEVKSSSFYDVSMCNDGPQIINFEYCRVSGAFEGDHYDGLFLGGGEATVLNSTLIVPHKQTSAFAVFNQFGPITGLTVENNLVAGGGFAAYGGEKCPGVSACQGGGAGEAVTGPVVFKNNRFARCTGKEVAGENGGHYCEGFPPLASDNFNQPLAGFGYWPKVGYFALWDVFNAKHTSASGNVYDDNSALISPQP